MKYLVILIIALLLICAAVADRQISRKRYNHYLAQQRCIVEFWDRDGDPNGSFVVDVEGVEIVGCKFELEPDKLNRESTQSCKSEHIHLGNPCKWN